MGGEKSPTHIVAFGCGYRPVHTMRARALADMVSTQVYAGDGPDKYHIIFCGGKTKAYQGKSEAEVMQALFSRRICAIGDWEMNAGYISTIGSHVSTIHMQLEDLSINTSMSVQNIIDRGDIDKNTGFFSSRFHLSRIGDMLYQQTGNYPEHLMAAEDHLLPTTLSRYERTLRWRRYIQWYGLSEQATKLIYTIPGSRKALDIIGSHVR